MPFEDRIYLEMKTADWTDEAAGHMYLVKRSVWVENGVVLSNDYDSQNDRVIRGAFGLALGASEEKLGDSLHPRLPERAICLQPDKGTVPRRYSFSEGVNDEHFRRQARSLSRDPFNGFVQSSKSGSEYDFLMIV